MSSKYEKAIKAENTKKYNKEMIGRVDGEIESLNESYFKFKYAAENADSALTRIKAKSGMKRTAKLIEDDLADKAKYEKNIEKADKKLNDYATKGDSKKGSKIGKAVAAVALSALAVGGAATAIENVPEEYVRDTFGLVAGEYQRDAKKLIANAKNFVSDGKNFTIDNLKKLGKNEVNVGIVTSEENLRAFLQLMGIIPPTQQTQKPQQNKPQQNNQQSQNQEKVVKMGDKFTLPAGSSLAQSAEGGDKVQYNKDTNVNVVSFVVTNEKGQVVGEYLTESSKEAETLAKAEGYKVGDVSAKLVKDENLAKYKEIWAEYVKDTEANDNVKPITVTDYAKRASAYVSGFADCDNLLSMDLDSSMER